MWETIFDDLEIMQVPQSAIDGLGAKFKGKPAVYLPYSRKAYVSDFYGPYSQYEFVCHEIAHHVLDKKGVPRDSPDLELEVNKLANDQCDEWLK